MSKRKYVDVSVSWCNGDCTPAAKVPLVLWEKIQLGTTAAIDTFYWYEGKRYAATFTFNRIKRGSLEVTGDDGLVGFEGDLADASIVDGSATRAS